MKTTLTFRPGYPTVTVNVSDANDHQQRYWVNGHFYEARNRGYLLPFIADHTPATALEVVYDLGASFGNHALFFGAVMKSRKVYAFEPTNFVFSRLLENVELNGLEKTILTKNVLIGGPENQDYWLMPGPKNNAGMNTFSLTENTHEKHTSISLDELVMERSTIYSPPTLIKIDVEGMEWEVVQGAVKTIRAYRPYIFVECVDSKSLHRIDFRLRRIGYTRHEMVLNATPVFVFIP